MKFIDVYTQTHLIKINPEHICSVEPTDDYLGLMLTLTNGKSYLLDTSIAYNENDSSAYYDWLDEFEASIRKQLEPK